MEHAAEQTAFTPMAEKTFYIVLKVAHDEDLCGNRATNAVLAALGDGIEKMVFPVFTKGRDGEEYEILVEELEFY